MPRLWLPKAKKLRGPHSAGGSMVGGPPRVTWHTTENDPTEPNVTDNVADYLIGRGYEPTVIWNPHTGELGQFLPANRSAYALEHPLGTPETNRQGDVNIQIEVVGRAAHPFTGRGKELRGLDELLAWFEEWDIPARWPSGEPLAYPASYGEDNGNRDVDRWLRHAGHFGHSQVPHNHHGDPGRINIKRLTGERAIAGLRGSPDPAPTRPRMARTLVKLGTSGPAAHAVELALGLPADGTIDELDDAAIRQWQRTHGHRGDGSIGDKAQRELAAHHHLLRRDHAPTAATRALQTRLGITVDGVFGPDTEAAVKAFQGANDLVADGVVGAKTARKLGAVAA